MADQMAHLPVFWGAKNPTKSDAPPQSDNAADAVLALSRAGDDGEPGALMGGKTKLLGAVSTLLALTPRGRSDELARLCALAHGYIGIASEDELMGLAKAVSARDDVGSGLPDRLARASTRAAETLIRANRLSDETIAYLLETGDETLQVLIARHHTLAGKHITMLVAQGSAPVLKALLENRQSDFSHNTQKIVEHRAATLGAAGQRLNEPTAHLAAERDRPAVTGANPRASAKDFATMDSAARRAVMHRLAEDAPKELSFSGARMALDPTRNDADLQFLTVIERRDQAALCTAFSDTLSLDPMLVRKLMDEADGDALIVLAKGAGLSSTAFARMLILGKVGLTGSPRDTFALVDRFNALPAATAEFLIQAMRGGSSSAQAQSKLQQAPQSPLPRQHRTSAAPSLPTSQTQDAPAKPRSILSLAKGTPTAQGFRKAI